MDTLGIFSVLASTSTTQAKGATADRLRQEVGAEQRRVYYGDKAEAAAGIGEPDGEDHETAERDADGRRPWGEPPAAKPDRPTIEVRRSKDPSGQTGSLLDITG